MAILQTLQGLCIVKWPGDLINFYTHINFGGLKPIFSSKPKTTVQVAADNRHSTETP